ncbi:MAG: hypothetical protein F6K62_27265 [Sphaerospermopsis sp. SIO1G2]|nr:hypothetical protein [Sphaerospermopsis sp. SIO1G2]
MLLDNSRKVNRSFALIMSMIFATTYSIPISAQIPVPTKSESQKTENSVTKKPQPVEAFSGQLAMFVEHKNGLPHVSFSPDGKQILTASATVRLWDIKGNLLVEFPVAKPGELPTLFSSVSFSPDGKKILTASEDGVRLWDIKGNLLVKFHKDKIQGAKFSPNGRQVLIITSTKLYHWD